MSNGQLISGNIYVGGACINSSGFVSGDWDTDLSFPNP